MRLLHLGWPHLPLRLERAARPLPEPVVLGGHPWDPGRVLDCSPAARRHGIRRGMTLAAAHALAPDAAFLVPDLDRYRAAAESALDALATFAPYVEGETDPERDEFGGAYLGIDGLERLWGAEPVLLGRIATAIAPHVPGPLRAGIAGSRFGSFVAAIVARDGLPGTDVTWHAVPPGGVEAEAAFLAPLPVTLLPATDDTQLRLRTLGVRRIGEFAALPRAAVMARFGAEGGFLHDLASGCDGRRIVPRRPAERLRASAELEPPVDSLESIRFVLHRLAEALCGQLTARGAGATVARLEWREAGGSSLVEQSLPGPTSRPEAVERLLLARLEVAPPRHPVEWIALELDRVVPAGGRQLGLFGPQAARAAHLEWQVADLSIRFGEGRVLRAVLHDPDARLPEDRVGWVEAAARPREATAPSREAAARPRDRPSPSRDRPSATRGSRRP